jgi:hypothetical protein
VDFVSTFFHVFSLAGLGHKILFFFSLLYASMLSACKLSHWRKVERRFDFHFCYTGSGVFIAPGCELRMDSSCRDGRRRNRNFVHLLGFCGVAGEGRQHGGNVLDKLDSKLENGASQGGHGDDGCGTTACINSFFLDG